MPNAVVETELRLPARPPFDADALFAFLAARAVPGIEHWDGSVYRRSLSLPHGHAVAALRAGPSGIDAELRLADRRDRDAAVRLVRRMLDLDADPVVIDAALAGDPVLAPLVDAAPGLRVPGSVDAFETAVRAIVGQQISVAGARTVVGRIVASVGEPSTVPDEQVTHVFPEPDALAVADPSVLPMPASRQATLVEVAARTADGRVVLDAGADRDDVARSLLEIKGVGPWTVGYVLMRGLGDPDVFLPTDLGARVGLARLGVDPDHADRWRPWRSYALHHLWAVAAARPTVRPERPEEPRCTAAR